MGVSHLSGYWKRSGSMRKVRRVNVDATVHATALQRSKISLFSRYFDDQSATNSESTNHTVIHVSINALSSSSMLAAAQGYAQLATRPTDERDEGTKGEAQRQEQSVVMPT